MNDRIAAEDRARSYFATLAGMYAATEATDAAGAAMTAGSAIDWMIGAARAAHQAGNKIMFIGNGGSAAIASHMATDYAKNGGLRATAFNDGAALTCLTNDLGFDAVFRHQIEMHARPGDLLVAISSSGRSANILAGVDAARARDCRVATLSGFDPDNPLRGSGDVNFYVPSHEYGFVEITHLSLCHAVLDLAMGWSAAAPDDATDLAVAS